MDNLEQRLESLRDGVGDMQRGLPGDDGHCTAAEVIDAAIGELRRLKNRKPIAWLCRDGDGKRRFIVWYISPCRTKKGAMAITKAQGYASEPIPVYE